MAFTEVQATRAVYTCIPIQLSPYLGRPYLTPNSFYDEESIYFGGKSLAVG